MRLLALGLLVTKPLLLPSLTLELALVLAQTVLLLPGLGPALIKQRQTQSEHGIDVFGFPMHAGAFETGLHHELVATLYTARMGQPCCWYLG